MLGLDYMEGSRYDDKNKVVVSLTDREKEHGLTYVALSRVTKFSNLGIKDTEGISKNRLCRKYVSILRWKTLN